MKLENLIEELERQKPLKWDKGIHSSHLEMALVENKLMFQINSDQSFSITKSCPGQIADKLDIPFKYYHKMENEAPELLAENVNAWLKKTDKKFFIRGLGDSIRAFLSERYRVIDHMNDQRIIFQGQRQLELRVKK